ncbi:hypothetical protein I6E81_06975 [Salinibacterium sp. NG22]|uniref:hypothetical protein n=1 Tax=Salinibacterium sp. NG22 TaxID=2792040 RepID=UPI0018CFB726|nr:hypothetical protein [Salinibacterium sp. NG22]MBH0109904.1 hypothetical protein [Salinibacterium sp. NG22]
MYGNMGYFPFAIALILLAIVVGAMLVYWLIRLAVGRAMRDHHKWLELRAEKTVPPEPRPNGDLPYDHNV